MKKSLLLLLFFCFSAVILACSEDTVNPVTGDDTSGGDGNGGDNDSPGTNEQSTFSFSADASWYAFLSSEEAEDYQQGSLWSLIEGWGPPTASSASDSDRGDVLSVSDGGWGCYFLIQPAESGSMDLSSVSNLHFVIKAASGVQSLKFRINDNNSGEYNSADLFTNFSTGEWQVLTVNLEDPALSGIDMNDIAYFGLLGNNSGEGADYGASLSASEVFRLSDIYITDALGLPGRVDFVATVINDGMASADISVSDYLRASSSQSIIVSNETEAVSINMDVSLNTEGKGTNTLLFGVTDDNTDTLVMSAGDVLSLWYSDNTSANRSDSLTVISSGASTSIYIHAGADSNYAHNAWSFGTGANWFNGGDLGTADTNDVQFEGGTALSISSGTGTGYFGIAHSAHDMSALGVNTNDYSLYFDYIYLSGDVSGVVYELEDGDGKSPINIATYTSDTGNIESIEIPLSDFVGFDPATTVSLMTVSTDTLSSSFILDDIHIAESSP